MFKPNAMAKLALVFVLVSASVLGNEWKAEAASGGSGTGGGSGQAIEAADRFSVRLKSDGTVWAWGSNDAGQLGQGFTSGTENSEVQVQQYDGVPLSRVTKIASGGGKTLALKDDGTVWAWGHNGNGELGDGTTENKSAAVQVQQSQGGPLNHIVAIAAGDGHSAALKADGTVWTWGADDRGQLGDGGDATSQPAAVQALNGADGSVLAEIISIAAGGGTTAALSSSGSVYAWGDNTLGQLGDGTRIDRDHAGTVKLVSGESLQNVKAIAAGENHLLALLGNGTVQAWGSNEGGQLGTGTSGPGSASEYPAETLLQDGTPLRNVMTIDAGSRHSLALLSDGTVWTWGANDAGQLGDGTSTARPHAARATVSGSTPLNGIVAIAGGSGQSLAISDSGDVWAWGANESGQLGDGTTIGRPRPVKAMANPGVSPRAIDVSAGGWHSVMLLDTGTVWTWGFNESVQLGNGGTYTNPRYTNKPVRVVERSNSFEGVTHISGGFRHTAALKSNGTVWTWGVNVQGALGNGSNINSSSAVQAQAEGGAGLSGFIDVSAGHNFTMALKSDGTVWAWGMNSYGQLGNGESDFYNYRSRAVQVMQADGSPLTNVKAISSGTEFALALKTDGTVWSWGNNSRGQLGDGTYQNMRTTAANVKLTSDLFFTGVKEISAGNSYSVSVLANGTLWSWGYNSNYVLGHSTENGVYWYPRQPYGGQFRNVSFAEAGSAHTAIGLADGSVWSWGQNYYGITGDGTSGGWKTQPVQAVKPGGGFKASNVDIAGQFSLALRSDGTVWSWGSNDSSYGYGGQLGGNSTNSQYYPILAYPYAAASLSEISASSATASVEGGGVTVLVRVKDQAGLPATESVGVVRMNKNSSSGTLSAVTDHGDGTYSAVLSSTKSGSIAVSALLNGTAIPGSVAVQFTPGAASPAASTISASPAAVTADGMSESAITVQLKDAYGNALAESGGAIMMQTTIGQLSEPEDHGDGRYTATLTSTTTGISTVSASLNGSQLANTANVSFDPGEASPLTSVITVSSPALLADGLSSGIVTVRLKDEYGNDLRTSGGTVVMGTTGGTIGIVTDHNDGTYTAAITAPNAVGSATISAALGGQPLANTATVQFEGSNYAMLASIEVDGTLVEGFNPLDTEYTIAVPHQKKTAAVTAAAHDAGATLTITGSKDLVVGDNLFTIQVTAQDGQTVANYTVILQRAPSDNANLSEIRIDGQPVPDFDQEVTEYTVTVPHTKQSVSVTASVYQAGATAVVWGDGSLDYGSNEVTINVTAQDGVAARTYTVNIVRDNPPPPPPSGEGAPQLSGNARLGNIGLSAGTLEPVFDPGRFDYTLRLAGRDSSITLSPDAAGPDARILVNGNSVMQGQPVMVPLPGERTVIQITVIAPNGARLVYTIQVENHDSEAEQVPETSCKQSSFDFSDMNKHWAHEAVEQAACGGIVTGYEDGQFKPDEIVSRAEFVVMLARAMDWKGQANASVFTDGGIIPDWAAEATDYAVQAEVIAGYEDGTFRPELPVTRAQVAVMAVRALGLSPKPTNGFAFADSADIPEWAKASVGAALEAELMQGRGGGVFAPNAELTRAEAAVIMLRLSSRISESNE
ncbi:RCC1 domain-containing protein [Paenibacillus soyae]|uniref:S-layer homology domain-containing protein n=1 Tax=Paenibacillus soyae TaxID=2969249 RepID=A0A9X2SC98_9BACL|nr:invasin domain 3-containing protein [Paenibacillus soyae]MCR2808041.1 S-layer homology domain-containing protein [Paenibacillus soyae]